MAIDWSHSYVAQSHKKTSYVASCSLPHTFYNAAHQDGGNSSAAVAGIRQTGNATD